MNLFNIHIGKFTTVLLVIVALITPLSFASAQLDPFEGSIVPECGDGELCGFCDLLTLAQNIMNFLVFIAVVIAILLFVHAGFLLVTGGASEAKRTKAKGIFWAVILGLILTLASWLIINLIMDVFLDSSAGFGVWTLDGCPGSVST